MNILDNSIFSSYLEKIFKKSSKVINIFYPRTCSICGESTTNPFDLCHNCFSELIEIESSCVMCGEILHAKSNGAQICGNCQNKPPKYDITVAPFSYEGPIRKMLHQLKYGKMLCNAKTLEELFLSKAKIEELPEVIIPVPIHKSRIIKRGYNQSEEIFKNIAKRLAIKFDNKTCKKILNTKHQASLGVKGRTKNLKGSFSIVQKHNYKHIAIVDDVITTGQTANEIAKLFRKSGVEKIQIWSCARSILK